MNIYRSSCHRPSVWRSSYLICTVGIIVLCIILLSNQKAALHTSDQRHIKGITAVATPRPYETDPFHQLKNIYGANWTCIVPYAYTPPDEPRVIYDEWKNQWWGERPDGIKRSIILAKQNDLQVLLKPQVWSWGGWTGDYDFRDEASWSAWEQEYTNYILHMARIAEELEVDAFCIGTEFKNAIAKRPDFWINLIPKIKNIYHGPMTYAANWDNYLNIPFWDQLDAIGINAYFPLSTEKTPSTPSLIKSWTPIKHRLKAFSENQERPICFTEYGYMSVDHAAWKTWENEARVQSLPINEQAQANAIEALHLSFADENWFLGGFLWKWFPEGMGGEGYDEKDYTPQNKMAEAVLQQLFMK